MSGDVQAEEVIEHNTLWLRDEAIKIDNALLDPNLTKEQFQSCLARAEELLLRTAHNIREVQKAIK